MAAQHSTAIGSLIAAITIFVLTSIATLCCALSEDNVDIGSENATTSYEEYYAQAIEKAFEGYKLHDIEEESLGRGVTWVLQWVYDRDALNKLIPLYGYDIGLLIMEDDAKPPTTTHPGEFCVNTSHKRDLSFFSALASGQSTWSPENYALGLAGIALESQLRGGAKIIGESSSVDPDTSENKEASSHILRAYLSDQNVEQDEDSESSEGVTLAVACEILPHVREKYVEKFPDQDLEAGTWYFIAENPIPDFEPDRLLWTNPSIDVIELSDTIKSQ